LNYIGYNRWLFIIEEKGGTCRNAYHGMSPYTMGITAHSTWKFAVPAGKSFLFKGCAEEVANMAKSQENEH
jgi:hypothetical protein